MAYVRGGSGPIGARVAGGGEPTRDSSPVRGDAAWRGINRQNTKADGKYGQAELPNREQGDGSDRMIGSAMPASTGGTVGSIKPRDSSPTKSERRFDTTYRIQPPAPKVSTTSAAPQRTIVKLTPQEVQTAVQTLSPLGYDRQKCIEVFARHKAEIQGKR